MIYPCNYRKASVVGITPTVGTTATHTELTIYYARANFTTVVKQDVSDLSVSMLCDSNISMSHIAETLSDQNYFSIHIARNFE